MTDSSPSDDAATDTTPTHQEPVLPAEPAAAAAQPAPQPAPPPVSRRFAENWRGRRLSLAVAGTAVVLACACGAGVTALGAVVVAAVGGHDGPHGDVPERGGKGMGDRPGDTIRHWGPGGRGGQDGNRKPPGPGPSTPEPASPSPSSS